MRPLKALISKSTLNRAHANLVGPGKDLKEWDIAIVGCECHTNRNENEVKCGTFHFTIDYKSGCISYRNANLDWEVMKDEYHWTYNNSYTHYILKVYRPKPGKEGSFKTNAPDISIEELETNPNYYCIYSNPRFLKIFDLK